MSLKYRKLSPSGDFTFGQGNKSFLSDLAACAQAVQTRMSLPLGSFWRDTSDGFDMFGGVLGGSGSDEHLAYLETLIQQRILGTPGAEELLNIAVTFDRSIRQFAYTGTLQTQYSTTDISGSL